MKLLADASKDGVSVLKAHLRCLSGAAFSSLPRRNAMEPGHLHKKNEEALLACPAIASATADEVVPLRSTCEVFSLTPSPLATEDKAGVRMVFLR